MLVGEEMPLWSNASLEVSLPLAVRFWEVHPANPEVDYSPEHGANEA